MKKTIYCLNCGKRIDNSNYCHHCGQRNTDKRISVKEFLHDFLKDYFTFDSKFFRSIFPLLFKPGHLTNEYITGWRVNFILPLRLYLFTTFIFFFVIAIQIKIEHNKVTDKKAKTIISKDSLLLALDIIIPSLSFENKQHIVSHLGSLYSILPKKS